MKISEEKELKNLYLLNRKTNENKKKKAKLPFILQKSSYSYVFNLFALSKKLYLVF